MTFPDNQMLSVARRHSNVWKSHLVGCGNTERQQYCRKVHLSLETLSQATLGDSGIITLKSFALLFRSTLFFQHKETCNTSRLALRLEL